jgi:hypothetical protein
MRIVIPIALLVVHFAFSLPAEAAGKRASRQSREKAARKACIMGDYQKGADILADLFVETDDLTYVYNQGRCFEQNHRWEEALDRFREYQRKIPNPTEDDRRDIESHIAECKSHLPEQTTLATAPAPPPEPAATPPVLPATSPPPPPLPPAASLAAEPAPRPENRGSGLRAAGIAAGVLGVAGITTGALLAMKTGTLTDELNQHYNRDKAATRDSYETWGWVSYGVGAAALVTGTTLYILGWRAGKSQPAPATVAVVPMFSPDGKGVFLQGAY